MAIAEARRTSKLVVQVQVEEAWFALSAVTTFNVFLAGTESCFGVA